LGIGLPVIFGVSGGLIYYFIIFKPKTRVIPADTANSGGIELKKQSTDAARS
jgi:hypothetical protein